MKRFIFFALLLVGLVVVLAACAAAATPAAQDFRSLKAPGIAPFPAATSAPAPTAAPAAPAEAGGTQNSVPDAAAADRMIVYTTNLSLQVDKTEDAIPKITDIAKSVNGYVSNTNFSRNSDFSSTSPAQLMGTITLRIPAQSLDAAMTQIKAIGIQVLSEQKNSNDVTSQYVDLDARRRNLEATEAELVKLLDTVRQNSNKAEDILAVYRELTNIRSQIEQIKGQQNVLDNTSTLATVTIQLVPKEIVVINNEKWDPGNIAASALKQLVLALQGLTNVLITFALFILPLMLVIALPFVLLFFIARALYRRNRRKAKAVTAT